MSCSELPLAKRNQVRNRSVIEQREHEDEANARRVLSVDECGLEYKSITDGDGVRRFPVDANVSIDQLNAEINIENANTPEIINFVATLANTEYTISLPDGTKDFSITTREKNVKLRLSFVLGGTATNYLTIPFGGIREFNNKDLLNSFKIYISSSKAGATIEINPWKLV